MLPESQKNEMNQLRELEPELQNAANERLWRNTGGDWQVILWLGRSPLLADNWQAECTHDVDATTRVVAKVSTPALPAHASAATDGRLVCQEASARRSVGAVVMKATEASTGCLTTTRRVTGGSEHPRAPPERRTVLRAFDHYGLRNEKWPTRFERR